jgi:predicted nucleic acid-binding protein
MRRVFADTFYWIAISNPADQWHAKVRQTVETLGDFHIVTTDEVLVEYLAAMSGAGRRVRQIAVENVRSILEDGDVTALPQSHQTFLDGLSLYSRRDDKAYSLVDCISMNACRDEGITEVLTSDHHFEQEGFTVLIAH